MSFAYEYIKILAFEITDKCNLNCDFCIRDAHLSHLGNLTFKKFVNRFEKLMNAFSDLMLVALTGGEPFLNPELENIIDYISHVGSMGISITTNANIINKKLLNKLSRKQKLQLIVSLDGPSPDIHDSIRNKNGSFKKIAEFLSICNQLKINFMINMTVCNKNYRHVYETIEMASSLGANNISIAFAKPHGKGYGEVINRKMFTEVGYQVLLAKKKISYRMPIKFSEPLAHVFDVSQYNFDKVFCGAGSQSLHVQLDGTILFCTSSAENIGNLDKLNTPVSKILSEEHRFHSLFDRTNLSGNCSKCDFKEICGGCRCRAKNIGKGFLSEDPMCPKNQHETPPDEIENINKFSPQQAGGVFRERGTIATSSDLDSPFACEIFGIFPYFLVS